MITKSLLIQGCSWNSRFVLHIILSAKKWSWGNYFWQLACMACYIHLASSDRIWKRGKSWHNLFVSELNWDGIRYSSSSDPFGNWASWYLVVWLLDWVLEIRALWLFPELNSVNVYRSWPKHLHCQHAVLKSQSLPVSTAMDLYIRPYICCWWWSVSLWCQKVSILSAVGAASLLAAFFSKTLPITFSSDLSLMGTLLVFWDVLGAMFRAGDRLMMAFLYSAV